MDSLSHLPPRTIPNTVGGVLTSTSGVWLVPFPGRTSSWLPHHLLRKHEPSSQLTPERSQRLRVMHSARGAWSGGQAPPPKLTS
jgi:hypothetical protein